MCVAGRINLSVGYLAREGLTQKPGTTSDSKPWRTHLPRSPLRLYGHLSLQSPHPIPLQTRQTRQTRAESKGWEMELLRFYQRPKETRRYFWVWVWKPQRSLFALCMHVTPQSGCVKGGERTPCHWMSQHVVCWSCCWSNNRVVPSEGLWASLAAAISALVPLLITTVDQLCTISKMLVILFSD